LLDEWPRIEAQVPSEAGRLELKRAPAQEDLSVRLRCGKTETLKSLRKLRKLRLVELR
jgi:hypothetical protein